MEVRDSVVGFKVAVRLFAGWSDMTLGKQVGNPAGVNRELLENSAAGMKLIRKPSQVGVANFCRLCDLRSRGVCLCRAPKVFAGLTAVAPGGHPAIGKLMPPT